MPNRPIASEAEYFDRLIDSRGEFNPFSPRGWQTLTRAYEHLVGAHAAILLDVGCGTGQSRQIYQSRIARYIGIDLSLHALRLARQSFPSSGWLCADACALPLANDSVDVVAFSSVLHHIPRMDLALGEAYRVLKPGGHVFAFDPNLLHPAMALFRHPKSPLYRAEGVSPHEKPLMPGALRAAFASAKFVDIRQRCQANIPYRAVAPRLLNAFLSLYNAGDWLMERSGLGRYFGTFIVTAGAKHGSGVSSTLAVSAKD